MNFKYTTVGPTNSASFFQSKLCCALRIKQYKRHNDGNLSAYSFHDCKCDSPYKHEWFPFE